MSQVEGNVGMAFEQQAMNLALCMAAFMDYDTRQRYFLDFFDIFFCFRISKPVDLNDRSTPPYRPSNRTSDAIPKGELIPHEG
jgi:hypothetical protein